MDGKKQKVAIFCSGSGTNAEKIIEYFKDHSSISINLLVSNKEDAFALTRAKNANINTLVINREQFYKSNYLVEKLQGEKITWIILAGFLLLIPQNLISAYPERIINIHPALLPKYGGKGMYGMNVHEAIKNAGELETGITIHLVNPKYDDGEIIFQSRCNIEPGDSAEDIAKKVQQLEHLHFAKEIEKRISKNL